MTSWSPEINRLKYRFSEASNLKSDNFIGSEEDLTDWTKRTNSEIIVYDKDYSLLQLQ